MGKKRPRIPVDDYFTSVHYGVCLTPDEVLDIRISERTFFEGNLSESTSLYLSNLELFGGDQDQGGAAGVVDFNFGEPDACLTAAAARKLDYGDGIPLTPDTAPGYRGFLSLFFRGVGPGAVDGTGVSGLPVNAAMGGSISIGGGIGNIAAAIAAGSVERVPTSLGFLWGTNNPVLPPPDVRVRRSSKGLNPAFQTIVLGEFHHANPAHMVFEMMTSFDFGSGISPGRINVQTFEDAAETLYNEGFGLSFIWTREDEIEARIQDVLSHIRGVVFIDPNDGLFAMRLIRDDFVTEDLEVFGPENIAMTDYQRKGRGELTNNYTATYTNPITQNDETITATDEAGVAMQEGEIVAGSGNFHMIRDPDLALRVAERELRLAAAPVAQGQFTGRRILSRLRPADVFLIRYPEYLGERLITARVTQIDYGRTDQPQVIVTWIEDAFTLPQTIREARDASFWIDPGQDPAPLEFQTSITLPYALTTQVPDLNITEDDFPSVVVGLLGDQIGTDTQGFDALGEFTAATGDTGVEGLGRIPLTERVELTSPLVAQANSIIRVSLPDRLPPQLGDFLMIGNDEDTSEIVLVTSPPTVDGTEFVISVARGVLDTIPRERAAGSDVWILGSSFAGWDLQPRTADVPISYLLLPVTSRGRLAVTDATPITYTPSDRLYAPNRPANITVGGTTQFGIRIYDLAPMVVPVTFSTRNRLSEDAIARQWTEPSVVQEVGQTTTIEILTPGGVVVTTIAGLTGSSHDIPIGDFGAGAAHILRFSAVRDGIVSFQSHEISVLFRDRSGYGAAYGSEYGD